MVEHAVGKIDDLRRIYPSPKGRAVQKVIPALDEHCRRFIAYSPILMLGTDGDVSPRGDDPGFVKVSDDKTLVIPDRKGNFRVDSMQNILRNPKVALLFMVPGLDHTLRVRGKAEISIDPETLAPLAVNGKPPASAIVVHVEEAFLHCGKALIRADLWNPEAHVADGILPSPGRMLADHINADGDDVERRYDQGIADAMAEEGRTVLKTDAEAKSQARRERS